MTLRLQKQKLEREYVWVCHFIWKVMVSSYYPEWTGKNLQSEYLIKFIKIHRIAK